MQSHKHFYDRIFSARIFSLKAVSHSTIKQLKIRNMGPFPERIGDIGNHIKNCVHILQ